MGFKKDVLSFMDRVWNYIETHNKTHEALENELEASGKEIKKLKEMLKAQGEEISKLRKNILFKE